MKRCTAATMKHILLSSNVSRWVLKYHRPAIRLFEFGAELRGIIVSKMSVFAFFGPAGRGFSNNAILVIVQVDDVVGDSVDM